jgi:hypothetical protein
MTMIRQALKWLSVATGTSLLVVVIVWALETFPPLLIELTRAVGNPFIAAAIWIGAGFFAALFAILLGGGLRGLAAHIKALWGKTRKEHSEALIAHAGSHVENEIFKSESGTLKNLIDIAGEKLPTSPLLYVPSPEGTEKGKDPIWGTKLLMPTNFLLYNGLFKACVVSRIAGKSPAVAGVGPSQHVILEASQLDGGDRDEHDR